MSKTLEQIFSRFQPYTVPLVLLATCLLAFGALSPWLGFYQDDWHFIYYARQGLDKLWELSAYDNRPLASWPYIGGFALLGFRPFAWQITVLLLRWLTTVAFWLFFAALWPRQKHLAAIPALLFAIYPFYTLQPMAVTYITHWVCYLLYALSMWLMVLGARDPARKWPLLVLSVALDALQLFTIEYFNGIELLRPVVLWFVLSEDHPERQKRLKRTAWSWLPYALVLLAFVLWRTLVFESPARDTNAPTVLRDLLHTPIPTLTYLLGAMLKDSLLILAGAWGETIGPALIDFTPAGLLILALADLSFAGFLFYFRHSQPEGNAPLGQMAVLGALGLLLGPIPAWMTRQPLYQTNPLWNSRLGMASMFGAALLLTALIEWLVRTRSQRLALYSLMLALSIAHLLASENDYRHAWQREQRFLEQVAWRIPAVEPGTALVSEGELLSLMGDYPTAFALNNLYLPSASWRQAPLWYFPAYAGDGVADSLLTGGKLGETKFSVRFAGQAADSLIIWYDPGLAGCMHVLTPQDATSPLYSDFLRAAARSSALSRIRNDSNLDTHFLDQALRRSQDWCSYYQRAELAAQNGLWEDIRRLGEEARQAGLDPSYGAEYLPFIRAALALGRESEAEQLSRAAVRMTSSQAMRQTLCLTWRSAGGTVSQALNQAIRCTP